MATKRGKIGAPVLLKVVSLQFLVIFVVVGSGGQQVYAQATTIKLDADSCEKAPLKGRWEQRGLKCILEGPVRIQNGVILMIGKTFESVIRATFENDGTVDNWDGFNSNGTFSSCGTLSNHDSASTILNHGAFNNKDNVNNLGTFINYGAVLNNGKIKNEGFIQTLYGSITNSDTIDNDGRL